MTLFVAGVHAVGKSFLLKPICTELAVRYASASQLIKQRRGSSTWTESRQVDGIDENQQALIAAVRQLKCHGEAIILDGHFVLRQKVNVHEKIPIEIFAQLGIRAIMLLEAPSETVNARLRQRGDVTWEQSEIEFFAQKELEHAESVSRELNVPFVRLVQPTETEMRNSLEIFL